MKRKKLGIREAGRGDTGGSGIFVLSLGCVKTERLSRRGKSLPCHAVSSDKNGAPGG